MNSCGLRKRNGKPSGRIYEDVITDSKYPSACVLEHYNTVPTYTGDINTPAPHFTLQMANMSSECP